jgi:hypothetical protein
MYFPINKQLISFKTLRPSVSALPRKGLKDVFSFQMSPRATWCSRDIIERACSRLYCASLSGGTAAANTGQGLVILIHVAVFLNRGKRSKRACKAATTTTVQIRDALYPTIPHPTLHKHSATYTLQNNGITKLWPFPPSFLYLFYF